VSIQFDPLNWTLGVSFIRDVPQTDDAVYLVTHYEQALCIWLGPVIIRFWFFQSRPRP